MSSAERRSGLELMCVLSLLAIGCDRRAAEPPAQAPTPPAEVPRLPSEAPRAPSMPEPSRAEPTGTSATSACALLPEVAVRVFGDVEDSTRIERDESNLAGLDACRYRWRKSNAAQIAARNADRAQQNPALLAAIARRTGGVSPFESSESELRLSVYPPRSGTPSMLARGFTMAHGGEQPVAALGDQASFNPARQTLTARKGNRTIDVLVRVSSDEAATLALATRVARDVLSRLP